MLPKLEYFQPEGAVLPEDAGKLPTPFFADDGADESVVREYRIRTGEGAMRWIRERRISYVRVGRLVRFDPRALARFIEANRIEARE